MMEEDAHHNRDPGQKQFVISGTIGKLTEEFFEKDPPIVGEGNREQVCWPCTITDATGELEVKVWEKPFHTIFGLTSSGVRELWEKKA